MRSWLVLILLACAQTLCAQGFSSKVIGVVDGDTYQIIDEEKEMVKVMLSEVDAPELTQNFGPEALEFSKKLLLKKKVTIEFKGKDFFGNKLAIITLKDGRKIHELLLENGLAMVRERNKDKGLQSMQEGAKSSGIGLWSMDEPETPWVYRRKQTMLQAKSR